MVKDQFFKIAEDFLKVRSLLTVMIFSAIVYLTIRGKISTNVLTDFAKYLLAFWFGQKAAKLGGNKP